MRDAEYPSYIFANGAGDEVVASFTVTPEQVAEAIAQAAACVPSLVTTDITVTRVTYGHATQPEPDYAELQARADGRLTIATNPFPYTVAMHEGSYIDFGLDPHDHLDW